MHHFLYHQIPLLKTKLKNILPIYAAGIYCNGFYMGCTPPSPSQQGKILVFKSPAKTTPAY